MTFLLKGRVWSRSTMVHFDADPWNACDHETSSAIFFRSFVPKAFASNKRDRNRAARAFRAPYFLTYSLEEDAFMGDGSITLVWKRCNKNFI